MRIRRPKKSVLTGAVAALGVCSVVLAFIAPGVEETKVDLNDGGVWVTNAKRGIVAHVNVPARLMDAGLHAASSTFDVFQNGEQVQLSDQVANTLAPIDVTTATLTSAVDYRGMTTDVRGGTIAVTDAPNGKVWAQQADHPAPINADDADASISDVPGAVTTVDLEGNVHAVSAEAGRVTSLLKRGALTDTTTTPLTGIGATDYLQIAAVGTDVVVWDQDTSTLYLPGGKTQRIDGERVVLQDTGPKTNEVLLSSPDALIRVPIGGGTPTTTPAPAAGGSPTRPVLHNKCAYAAWSVTGAFVRDCPSDADDREMVVDSLASAEKAIFRTNRDVIVLNDIEKDGLWLPDSDMILVDNWDQLESKLESEKETEDQSVDDIDNTVAPDRNQDNTPPEAVDDDFGVRAGKTAILPVLMNDSDADGDFMTASALTQPSLGQVSVAREGAALQIAVNKDASGTSTFDYEVSDGRGGTAQAHVTLTVHGDDVNEAPVQKIVPSVSVGQGGRTTVNGLTNWVDPDGDPFFLAGATAPTGMTVNSHENGNVEIIDAGHAPGKDAVAISVSDGRDAGDGSINVTVKESANEPPVANADHLVVREGASASISPMANDTDPNSDTLRLVSVDDVPAGITAVMDSTAGTITVDGNTAGTYYLSYTITDGPTTATGIIRVDVAPTGSDLPPSTEDDLGVLPDGGQVLVDLLANDSDPTGGVLTVQQLDVPPGSPLAVALVNRQMVRVTAPSGLSNPASFTYTVSNGVATASATVTILPAPANTESAPPELNDDSLVVRVGDVASVSVLDNDRSPAGLKLTVSSELQHEIPADLGSVFVSNNVVRVRGGSRPGSGRIVYTVSDTAGNVASAVVNLTVVAMDEDTNTAPRPKDVVARTVAGHKVTIPIPLEGIDAEGDSVTLVGMASSARLGTVTQVGSNFEYTPGNDVQGTDSFTYVVEDALGKQAIGGIRVGVAPRPSLNQAPVAMPDSVRVRPGTKVSVAVLANDIDPDGDPLTLAQGSVSAPSGIDVTERSGRIVFTAPQQEGTHVISYAIEDGAGGRAEGVCSVVVTPTAPLLAPIARDDEVSLADVQAASGSVSVDVLKNDEDPDGDIQDDTLSSPDSGIGTSGDTLTIPLSPKPQTVIYTVTDHDGLSASAVVRVPGTEITRPTLDTRALPIKVTAGVTKEIALNDYILTRSGRSVQLTGDSKASAGLGWDGSTLVKDTRTLTYTALEDFSGPTSIIVEVTDGSDPSDATGIVSTLALPILVESAHNRPPRIVPTRVDVAAGEDASQIAMDQWVTDPDGDDPAGMTYTITDKQVEGVSASASGSTLSVSADAEAPKGQAGQLTIEVTDQQGASASASVPVNVIASSKPLVQTSPGQITLKAGESKTVDVSEYATNPLADQGPLTIMGDPATSAGGSATASGSTMTIQADAGFNGSFTVTYRVQDATKDVEREVQGTITATVLDKPGAPTGASAVSNSAGTALVSWRTGTTGGSPITSFTVTDHTQGDSKSCGAVAECLFDGRTNGTEHTFSVTATNEVGESDPSNKTSVLIDAKPETPGAPTVKPGDGSITVSWAAPVNTGSDLEGYDVELSPGGVQQAGANETSKTISGLTNGHEYMVRVRARNKNYTSEWSSFSQGVTPYGAPEAPTGVSATFSNGTAQVTWNEPSNTNGRNIEQYTVSANGAKPVLVDAPTTSTSFELEHSEQQVSISVKAVNDTKDPEAHTSPAATTTVWAVGQVNAPTITSPKATGNSKEIAFNIKFEPGNGWSMSDVVDYQWTPDGDHWDSLTRDGNHTVTSSALTDGVDATLQVKVTVRKSGTDKTSEAVATGGTVSSFGPPTAPTVSCRPGGPGWVDCDWNNAASGGRPTQLILTGNTSETIPSVVGAESGHRSFNPGEGGSAQLCVKAVQTSSEKGTRESGQPCDRATAPSYARSASGFRGGSGKCVSGSCGSGPFDKVGLDLSGWPPNASVRCSGKYDKKDAWVTLQVDGNGNWRGVPGTQGLPGWTLGGQYVYYLVGNDDKDFNGWFTCTQ
ncbi:Ig-like domain-containing protein [Pauljensenia sp. 20925_1_34]|uniref:Ig-like domain-containing protein n=1 Tax=Pauljensenia sp. 20925_1_34 TaxID=3003674 RepID=UPI00352FD7A1